MIAPYEPDSQSQDRTDLEHSVAQFISSSLGIGGPIARYFEHKGLTYRYRPEQEEMAQAVGRKLVSGDNLGVEAATGLGKSFAYLIPAMGYALATGQRVVISTYTISLQEQLMYKDIPLLLEAMDIELNAVLAKGRQNYLCRRRLALAWRMGGDLFKADEKDELTRIKDWADATAEGSLQDLPFQPSAHIWEQVCVEEGTCMWPAQKNHADCFLSKARRAMHEAQLLIVNHHLFFADFSIRVAGGGFLPEYAGVIFDEAHQMEPAASGQLGMRLTPFTFERWIRRLYVPETRKGLLTAVGASDLYKPVHDLREQSARFFDQLKAWGQLSESRSSVSISAAIPIETNIDKLLGVICRGLEELIETLEDDEIQGELASLMRKGIELRNTVLNFLHPEDESMVYWLELGGKRQNFVTLNAAPLEVGAFLKEHLFAAPMSITMASATLAVSGSMDYFLTRIGGLGAETLILDHIFNYSRQMRVYVASEFPEPSAGRDYEEALAEGILHFCRKSQGRALVLFTSKSTMLAVANRLRGVFDEGGFPLWVQGIDLGRHALLEKFKITDHSVLFGLSSFWMGVDLPGDLVRNVIITRLPFSVPDHPLTLAKTNQIKKSGGDPFRNFSLPEAIIRFRQGVGRLIRTHEDEGILVILDSRIAKKNYGKSFIKALPECEIEPWTNTEDF